MAQVSLVKLSFQLTVQRSTLAQVMVWCHQTTNHYFSQCWCSWCCHMVSLGHNELTHWGQNKMPHILQTAFSQEIICVVWFEFHWGLFLRVQWMTSEPNSTKQVTGHYLNQRCPNLRMPYGVNRPRRVNTLRQRQNGCHFPNNIFKCIFLNAMFEFWLMFHWNLFLRVH